MTSQGEPQPALHHLASVLVQAAAFWKYAFVAAI